MEPLKTYDYLARTRRRVFDWIRPLGPEAYGREFPIGPGTLGRVLTHIMMSEWYYVQRIRGADVPLYEQWPINQEDPPPFASLEATWTEQADQTRAALAAVADWAAVIEYRPESDGGPAQIVTTSAGGLFTQLVLHEVHHRAQVLNMLRRLDVKVDDLDYNSFFERREA